MAWACSAARRRWSSVRANSPSGASEARSSNTRSMAVSSAGPCAAAGLEDLERLLEEGHGLAVRRARRGLGARLAQVVHRPVAQTAAQGVVGEPLDVLAQAPG